MGPETNSVDAKSIEALYGRMKNVEGIASVEKCKAPAGFQCTLKIWMDLMLCLRLLIMGLSLICFLEIRYTQSSCQC